MLVLPQSLDLSVGAVMKAESQLFVLFHKCSCALSHRIFPDTSIITRRASSHLISSVWEHGSLTLLLPLVYVLFFFLPSHLTGGLSPELLFPGWGWGKAVGSAQRGVTMAGQKAQFSDGI